MFRSTAVDKKPARAGFLFALLLAGFALLAQAQDYDREKRWADEILATLVVGESVWLKQGNGHQFLTLYTVADRPRGAVILAHGRGWSPDYELYGELRARIADAGYTTLSIQLPVLDGTAKLVDYIQTYPDARERFQLAADFLKTRGYKNIAIVSHSLGATMANQYLIKTNDDGIKAWVFISIINGLEEMFRIKIPVLDVFGSNDWQVTRWGAEERKLQIMKNKNSEQVLLPGAGHFFEGKEHELAGIVVKFFDQALHQGSSNSAER